MEKDIKQVEEFLRIFIWIMIGLNSIIIYLIVVIELSWRKDKPVRLKISNEVNWKLSDSVDKLLAKMKNKI